MEDELTRDVAALARTRYARDDAHPGSVRWGRHARAVYLADQKPRKKGRLPIESRPFSWLDAPSA